MSVSAPKSKADGPFPWMKLPRELCIQVLEFTDLTTDEDDTRIRVAGRYEMTWESLKYACNGGLDPSYPPIDFFLISRTFHAEAKEVLLRGTRMVISDRIGDQVEWLRQHPPELLKKFASLI